MCRSHTRNKRLGPLDSVYANPKVPGGGGHVAVANGKRYPRLPRTRQGSVAPERQRVLLFVVRGNKKAEVRRPAGVRICTSSRSTQRLRPRRRIICCCEELVLAVRVRLNFRFTFLIRVLSAQLSNLFCPVTAFVSAGRLNGLRHSFPPKPLP